MIGDLDVIVYIFLQSAELALLPHTYFERIEEKKKNPLQFVNLICCAKYPQRTCVKMLFV